jgi:hypothetical protein
MKTKTISMFVAILALVLASATGAVAQHEHHAQGDQQKPGSMDMSKMMREPNHVLAMAYMQNLATFAKALRDQTEATKTADSEFTRTAVSEMRRSFDAMQQQMADHMKSMSADMQSHMSMMMKEMQTHISAIKESLAALEHEAQADTPEAGKVSASAAEIVKHIDEMGHSHGEHKM